VEEGDERAEQNPRRAGSAERFGEHLLQNESVYGRGEEARDIEGEFPLELGEQRLHVAPFGLPYKNVFKAGRDPLSIAPVV